MRHSLIPILRLCRIPHLGLLLLDMILRLGVGLRVCFRVCLGLGVVVLRRCVSGCLGDVLGVARLGWDLLRGEVRCGLRLGLGGVGAVGGHVAYVVGGSCNAGGSVGKERGGLIRDSGRWKV